MFVLGRFVGFVVALLACVLPVWAQPGTAYIGKADIGLVITTNLQKMDYEKSFYRTILLQADTVHPQYGALTIRDLSQRFWRTEQTLFISDGAIEKMALLQAGKPIAQGKIDLLAGAQVLTLKLPAWQSENPSDMIGSMPRDPLLARELSARQQQRTFAIYQIGEQRVIALDLQGKDAAIVLPTRAEELFRTPAAVGGYAQQANNRLFVASRSPALGLALGGVDKLLANRSTPTLYVDTGGALSAADLNQAAALQSMLLQRNPVLVAGPQDLQVFGRQPSLLAKQSYLVPSDTDGLQSSKLVKLGNKTVQISRIGALSDDAAVLLQQETGVTLQGSLQQAHMFLAQNSPDVAIAVLTHAADLQKHPDLFHIFDAVLVPVDTDSALPAEYNIVLRASKDSDQNPFPPVIQTTHDDITQLDIWLDQSGAPSRLHVIRHDLQQGAVSWKVAADARLFEVSSRRQLQQQPALPARGDIDDGAVAWSSQELDELLAGLLQQQLPKTDLVMTERSDLPLTPITSAIPRKAAATLLYRKGAVVMTKIEGGALKKVFKMIAKGRFTNLVVWGADPSGPTIQKAAVYNQTYRVAITQEAFWQVRQFLKEQGMLGTSDLQAERVVDFAAKTVGSLKTLGKVKLKNVKNPIALSEDGTTLLTSPRTQHLIAVALQKGLSAQSAKDLLQHVGGKSRHAMVLHITDLDLGGFIGSRSLGAAKTWRDDDSGQYSAVNGDLKKRFELHVLVNSGLRVGYEGPNIDTAITGGFKFFHVRRNEKPVDDSLTAAYLIRVPIERMIDNPTSWTFSPALNVQYETSVFPTRALKFLTDADVGSQDWNKWRDEKNHQMDFFAGAAVHPLNNNDYTYRFLAGPVARLYLKEPASSKDAWNPGVRVAYKDSWTWSPVKLKLETSLLGFIPIENPSNMTKDKEAFEWTVKPKLLFALVGNLSFGLLGDCTTGFTMKNPEEWGAVLRGGFGLSYNHRFKWDV